MNKTLTCIILVLLASTLALPLIPNVHSQTQSVKILSYSYYWDAAGLLDIVGEVQNQGPNVIDNIILTGIVTGDQGTQLNGACQVWGNNLLPNQKAPFYMEFYPQTQDGQYFTEEVSTVELSVNRAEPTTQYQYQDLNITKQQSYIGTDRGTPSSATGPGTGDLGVFWVTCTIKNTGSQTAQNITLAGTFYDSAGKVVAVGLSDTKNPPSITASQSIDFKFGAYDRNQSIVPADQKIATYSLLIQNIGPLTTAGSIIPVPSVTSSPPPLSSVTPTQSSNQAGVQNDTNTIVYAVIAVGAVAAVAAAFLFIRKRSSPNQEPVVAATQKPYAPKKPRRKR